MSLEKSSFWSSESNEAKVIAISILLHPKLEKFSPQSHVD